MAVETPTRSDHDRMLAELLLQRQEQLAAAAPAAQPDPPAYQPRTARRRPPSDLYTMALTKAAILIALLLVGGMWWAGGFFTLRTLTDWGLPIASWGLAAWAIPLAITALEIGTLAGRVRVPALWLVWLAVLTFDIATTTFGLLGWADRRVAFGHTFGYDPTSGVIAGLGGFVIALGAEPAARALIKELLT